MALAGLGQLLVPGRSSWPWGDPMRLEQLRCVVSAPGPSRRHKCRRNSCPPSACSTWNKLQSRKPAARVRRHPSINCVAARFEGHHRPARRRARSQAGRPGRRRVVPSQRSRLVWRRPALRVATGRLPVLPLGVQGLPRAQRQLRIRPSRTRPRKDCGRMPSRCRALRCTTGLAGAIGPGDQVQARDGDSATDSRHHAPMQRADGSHGCAGRPRIIGVPGMQTTSPGSARATRRHHRCMFHVEQCPSALEAQRHHHVAAACSLARLRGPGPRSCRRAGSGSRTPRAAPTRASSR